MAFGFGEPGDPFGRGRELHALAGEARADRERDREVCFAGAGRSEQDHVLFGVEEVQLPEVLDHGLLDRALEGEVELLQRLAGGEPGGLDPSFAAVALAGADFGPEQDLGEPLIAPLLIAGAIGEHRQRAGGGRCLQRRGTGAPARTPFADAGISAS